MSRLNIYIRNMVSHRCIKWVEKGLFQMGLTPNYIFLGKVVLAEAITESQQSELRKILLSTGLELMNHRDQSLVESAKSFIEENSCYFEEDDSEKHLKFISEQLQCDRFHLSRIFEGAYGLSIHQFIVKSRIDKVKDLLASDGLCLTEISFRLNYNCSTHSCLLPRAK